jgi:hypothetical protein
MIVNVELTKEELEKINSEKKISLTINLDLKENKKKELDLFKEIAKNKTKNT